MRSSAGALGTIRLKSADWLRQGMSPRRLAFTLALGFVIGCLPLVGLPTALCALLALAFRLNQPAIQVANYAAMPFQVVLILPLVRLGGKLLSAASQQATILGALRSPVQLSGHPAAQFAMQAGGMAAQALLAWILMAGPVLLLLTPPLTLLLQRVPVLAEAGKRP